MKQLFFDHWKFISAIVLLIILIVEHKISMKKYQRESEAFIDTWWEEHSDMFVDTDGNLFLLIDKQEIFYPLEEKLF